MKTIALASSVLGVAYSYAPAVMPIPPSLLQTSNPFKSEGLNIDLPDFHKLFEEIQHVSPLAKHVIARESALKGTRGLDAINDKEQSLKWKTIERNPKGAVTQIDRIDRFAGRNAPMLRFRSKVDGPLVGEFFGKFIMDLESRKKWDSQVEQVYEIYPINDLDATNIAMGFGRFGDCSRIGIGYGQTKPGIVTPREQLFLYGLQDFLDGSCIIWGTELDEDYNHLLPKGKRHTRAKSHLFSATLVPTDEDSFDVEYVLQMDIGGNIPSFLTTPVMIDTVKSLFKAVRTEFAEGTENEELKEFLEEKQRDQLTNRHMLLMTP
jgi:hypothetical protein